MVVHSLDGFLLLLRWRGEAIAVCDVYIITAIGTELPCSSGHYVT